MRWSPRGAWTGPALAVALLAAVVIAGYLALVRPVASHNARLAGSIEAQQRLLQQYEAEIRARPVLLEQLEAIRGLARERGYHIEEASESLAAVALRTLLDSAASVTGDSCTVQSQQERPAAGEDSRIRVRARLRCSVEGLRLLLHELEGGRPVLVVESLQVRPRPAVGGRNREAAALDTTLELSARYAGAMQ